MSAFYALRTSPRKVELHEHQPIAQLWRQVVIGFNILEPHLSIEALRFALRRSCIKHHPAIAEILRSLDDGAGQRLTNSAAMELGCDEHPLHFARADPQLSQRDAAGDASILFCDKECAPLGGAKQPGSSFISASKAVGSK